MLIAALALLAGALVFAPLGSTQSGLPTLSATPPVALAPASTTPTATTQLPKTGLDDALVALTGLGMLAGGAALRRARGAPASRWRR